MTTGDQGNQVDGLMKNVEEAVGSVPWLLIDYIELEDYVCQFSLLEERR